MVVRAGEQCIVVRRVDGEEGNDASAEEVEGRRPLPGVDCESDRGGEEEDVAERIGGGDGLLEHREAREVDVRRDEEDPGEQCDADRDDQRVDDTGTVALRVTTADEDEQARDERRIDGQVDGVPDGRELDLGARQLGVAVGVKIAGEEEEEADDEEDPGRPCLGTVEVDPERDGDRRREAEQVEQRAVALQRREPEVRRGEDEPRSEVDEPGAAAPVESAHWAHAAYSCLAGRRSKALASFPRTSTSCSISAWELEAVTWMRKPTSLLGTSG